MNVVGTVLGVLMGRRRASCSGGNCRCWVGGVLTVGWGRGGEKGGLGRERERGEC